MAAAVVMLSRAAEPASSNPTSPDATAASAPATASAKPAADEFAARVVQARGAVTLTHDGAERALKADASVRGKTTIRTAAEASVMLAFPNATNVHLGARGEIALDALAVEKTVAAAEEGATPGAGVSRVVLRLVRGELAVQSKPLPAARGSSFNLTTDAGVLRLPDDAATLLVVATPTDVVITVIEGEVSFRPPGQEASTIAAGSSLRAAVLGAELLR